MFNFSKKSKSSIPVMYRHGDLLITRVNALPSGLVQINPKTIAEGEISGHKHRLVGNANVCVNWEEKHRSINDYHEVWFKAFNKIKVIHEEHKTLELPKGVYKVTKERQFDPFQGITQKVVD